MSRNDIVEQIREWLEEQNMPPSQDQILQWNTQWGFSEKSITTLAEMYNVYNRTSSSIEKQKLCNAIYRYSKSQEFVARYVEELRVLETINQKIDIKGFPIGIRVRIVKRVDVSRTIIPAIGTQGTVIRHSWQYDRHRWQELHNQYPLVWVKFSLPIYDQDNTVWLEEGDIDSHAGYKALTEKYQTASIGIYGKDQPLVVGFKVEEIEIVN